MLWILSMFLMLNLSFAEVGRVLKVVGTNDAYLLREGNKLPAVVEMELQEGDQVFAQSAHLVLHLYPSSQLSVTKGTEIIISRNVIEEGEKLDKAVSIIDLVKGMIRLQVVKDEETELDQKIEARNVAFSVRGTDFEVAMLDDEVDMDVYEGEVEVTSPHVHTFVPYHVKANEGFRFSRKAKAFARRNFNPRLKNNSEFMPREKIKHAWKERKPEFMRNRQLKKEGRQGRAGDRKEVMKARGQQTLDKKADRLERRGKRKPGNP